MRVEMIDGWVEGGGRKCFEKGREREKKKSICSLNVEFLYVSSYKVLSFGLVSDVDVLDVCSRSLQQSQTCANPRK